MITGVEQATTIMGVPTFYTRLLSDHRFNRVPESAVIGVPHPDLGEALFGVLVSKPNETPDLEGWTMFRKPLYATRFRMSLHPVS
jgi:acyl-CoA synthetase (AMP-forming)/AMP-acid ligase II